MSIVRVGLSENQKFADGYDAIFKKGTKAKAAKPAPEKADAKPAKKAAKPAAKKAAPAKKAIAKKK